MKVYDIPLNYNFLVKSFTFVHLGCSWLTFAFAINYFKIWPQNFGFAQTTFELAYRES